MFGRILAPPFGRRPGAAAPPPCPPLATPLTIVPCVNVIPTIFAQHILV